MTRRALPCCLLLAAIALECTAGEPLRRTDLYGDPLPKHAVARFGTIRFSTDCGGVALSPDGRLIASADGERGIGLWDAQSGKLISRVIPQSRPRGKRPGGSCVGRVAFSPDGRTLASYGSPITGGDEVRLWDVTTGRLTGERGVEVGAACNAAWSPDGRRLAGVRSDGTLSIWDAATGGRIAEFKQPKGKPLCVAFSSDGKQLAVGLIVANSSAPNSPPRGAISIWDLATGKIARHLTGPRSFVTAVAFTPDGKRLVSGDWDRTVTVWDLADGQPVGNMRTFHSHVCSVAVTADGKRIVSACSEAIEIWDAASRKQVRRIPAHTSFSNACISSDAQTIVSGGLRVAVWDAATGRPRRSWPGHLHVVASAAFIPDVQRIVSSGGQTLRFWDVATMRQTLCLDVRQEPPAPMVLAPDGRTLATVADRGVVKFWDAITGEPLPGVLDHKADAIHALAFSPDGEMLVSSALASVPKTASGRTYSSRLFYWKRKGDTFRKSTDGEYPLSFGIRFAPDQRKLVLSAAGLIRVFDWPEVSEVLRIAGPSANCRPTFSPDGRLLAAGSRNKKYDHFVECWDLDSKKRRWQSEQADTMGPVVFSPNGKLVASADRKGNIYLWSADRGKKLATLHGHHNYIPCLVFSADGKRLLSGSQDTTLLLWDVASALNQKT